MDKKGESMNTAALKNQFDDAIRGNFLPSEGGISLDGCRSFNPPNVESHRSQEFETLRDLFRNIVEQNVGSHEKDTK